MNFSRPLSERCRARCKRGALVQTSADSFGAHYNKKHPPKKAAGVQQNYQARIGLVTKEGFQGGRMEESLGGSTTVPRPSRQGNAALKRNEWAELRKWASFTSLASELLPSAKDLTPIVVAKTPIVGKLWHAAVASGALTEADRWTPEDCAAKVRERFGFEVGGVLNLCNTSKYYEGRASWPQSVYYAHVPVRGRVAPSWDCLEGAVSALEDVKSRVACNNNIAGASRLCVVVHCTHGVNRSGSVCEAFLASRLGLSSVDAAAAFSRARSYEADEAPDRSASSCTHRVAAAGVPVPSASRKRAADDDWLSDGDVDNVW